MTHSVRITNPSTDRAQVLHVHTYRTDVAPGEPSSLYTEVTIAAGETVVCPVYHGAVITITSGDAHG